MPAAGARAVMRRLLVGRRRVRASVARRLRPAELSRSADRPRTPLHVLVVRAESDQRNGCRHSQLRRSSRRLFARRQAAQMAQLREYRNELGRPPAAGRRERARARRLSLDSRESRGDWWSRTRLARLAAQSVHLRRRVQQRHLLDREAAVRERRDVRSAPRSLVCAPVPACSQQGRANLTQTVREFAQIASEDIRDGDSLYTTTLDEVARDASPAARAGNLASAQTVALNALHAYRAWLDARMMSFQRRRFCRWTQAVRLVSSGASCSCRTIRGRSREIGRLELARDRALEIWEDARDAHEPPAAPAPAFASKAAFLAYYERSLAKLVSFINSHQIVDDSAVHRSVPYRRGAQRARGDVSGRLHEPAADVFDAIRRASISFRISARAIKASSSSRRVNRCCRCSGTRGFRDISCSSPTPITIRTSSGTCKATASSPKAGPSTARRC